MTNPDAGAAHRRVAITVPTYRRPARLATLLPALRAQAEGLPGLRTDIIVIDNDPAGSARAEADAAGVAYVSEPRRGLAAVRNRALDAAADHGADALVFIDDDEVPGDAWLVSLVAPWVTGEADFVSGEVTTVFPHPPDPWIEAGGFFRRVRFAEGERMAAAPTNNLLIDLGFVAGHRLRFDERFAATGGEDIHFTGRASRLGARIVSAPAARVSDMVGPERLTRKWVLLRAFRVGTTTVRGDILLVESRAGRILRRARWALLGIGRFGVGAGGALLGRVTRSIRRDARGSRLAARGAGMVAGAVGVTYREYAKRGVTR